MIRSAFLAAMLGVAMLGGAVECAACNSHAVGLEGVRTALDVGGAALGSAYDLAVKACLERERLEIAAERDGKQASKDTDAAIARIRVECDRVRDGFAALRDVHSQAAAAYERGDIAAAYAELEQVKRRWLGLGNAGDVGVETSIDAGADAGADGGTP
jgi:hypothetical protein